MGRDAFEVDALSHIDALYRTALRMTRSEADAHDLVQETYVRAVRFRDQFTPGLEVRAGSELVTEAERTHVGLLDEIVGIRLGAGHAEGRAVEGVDMRQRVDLERIASHLVTLAQRSRDSGHSRYPRAHCHGVVAERADSYASAAFPSGLPFIGWVARSAQSTAV